MPTGDSLDLTGLDLTHAHVEDAVRVDREEWDAEQRDYEEFCRRSDERRLAEKGAADDWPWKRSFVNEESLHQSPGLDVALLGMSFLNRTEIRNEGTTLTLVKRF